MFSKFAAIALSGVLAFGTLSLTSSTPVSAHAETYTNTYNADNCFSYDGFEFCEPSHYIFHSTRQPDNDLLIVTNAHFCYKTSDQVGVVAESCNEYRDTYITREDAPQVHRILIKNEFTLDGQTCTHRSQFLYSNGEIRRDKSDFECK